VERADEVLALGQVHGGLAANRGVDLRQQRGGRLHHRDAAVVDRGSEARGVADDATTECHDGVATEQPPLREPGAQLVDRRERLRFLPVADQEDVGLGAGGVERGRQRRRVPVGHAGLADHRNLAAPAHDVADSAERALPDDDVVGLGERDRHPLHDSNSSITRYATSSTESASVSTVTSAAAS
jgi:hypothetical protein